MKEFIEKLIERLEEVYQTQEQEYTKFFDREGMNCIFDRADIECARVSGMRKMLEIAKEFKNEYYANTPQKSAGGWIPVTERLPKYDTESEYYEEVIVTLNNGIVTTGYYRNLDEEWWVQGRSMKCLKNSVYSVVAWQPFPKSYIPRGQWKDAVMNHFTKIE
jgi:hypothetical protein